MWVTESGLTKSATPPFKIPQWAEEFVGPNLEVLEDKTLCFPNQNKRKGQVFKMIKNIMYFVKEFLYVQEIPINYLQE